MGLTADIKIFERRLRTMGVEEYEGSPAPPKKETAKLEENENEEEEELKNEQETDETKDEVDSTDDDVKEEPDESLPVENGESSTPLTEVHENGQENPKEPEEPALKKELVNGTVEPAENEINRFIEEDSNDSQEEIKSSNKKIDLRNFQPLDTVWAK